MGETRHTFDPLPALRESLGLPADAAPAAVLQSTRSLVNHGLMAAAEIAELRQHLQAACVAREGALASRICGHCRGALLSLVHQTPTPSSLGRVIGQWVVKTLGPEILTSRHERALRVLEEATELAQAEGVAFQTSWKLIERVFSRPFGQPLQEAAGVGVTLLAWAEMAGVDLMELIGVEVDRILDLGAEIREKQRQKALAGLGMMP